MQALRRLCVGSLRSSTPATCRPYAGFMRVFFCGVCANVTRALRKLFAGSVQAQPKCYAGFMTFCEFYLGSTCILCAGLIHAPSRPYTSSTQALRRLFMLSRQVPCKRSRGCQQARYRLCEGFTQALCRPYGLLRALYSGSTCRLCAG